MSAPVEPTTRVEALAAPDPVAGSRRDISTPAVLVAFLGVCVWVLWRTGPGKIPNVETFEIIANGWPTIPMGPETAYVLRVPLGQIVYGFLPQQGTGTYLALHLACLLGTGVLLLAWMCRRLGARTGLVAGGILVLSPITAVLLLWIGMYDAFSVLTWVLLLMTLDRRAPWQFAAAVLAGVQNFEQVLVGLLMLLLVPRLPARMGFRPQAMWLLAGAVAGRIALELYFRSVGATPGGRATFLSWDTLSSLLASTAANGPLVLWSALAGLWGFAIAALLASWAGWSRRERLQLVLALGGWVLACAITADHTRVLAMTSFPLVVIGVMALADGHRDLRALVRLPQTWMLLLAPPLVVFDDVTLPMGIKPGLWGVWIF